jgi:hypothetical protein
MSERGPPIALARERGRRTRGLIALVAALTLIALAGLSASAGAATTVAQKIAALPTIQPFNGEATSLSQFGASWSQVGFAVEKGRDTTAGWRPPWAYPNVNGAFYGAASYTATTGGAAAAVTMAAGPATTSRTFSLWLDMPSPGSAKTGYELRFTSESEEAFTVVLAKWTAGSQTVLASQANVTLANGGALAIADEGATVSAWTNRGAGFTQLLSASDSAFGAGRVGISASGNVTRLTGFEAGQLAPAAPTLTRTNPASGADDNAPYVIGTATSGTTVNLYTSATCRGSPAATGTAGALASPGLQVRVADNTTTDFYATATDDLGNVSDCSSGISYTERTATSGIGPALARLPQLDAFATAENPLSGGGRWTQLAWASHRGRVAGSGTSGGWGPYNAFPVVHGAYWNPTSFADAGDGVAVAATLSVSPSLAERWFSLWLDASEPALARSGYELRFTNVDGVNRYDVTLSKWVSGVRTVLASSSGYTLAPQSSFALVDKGGVVSAWIDAGAGFAQLLTASDATFSRGYVGLEGAGNITRVRQFRAGVLPSETSTMLASQPVLDAFATAENPLSGGGRWTQLAWASHRGRVAGSGTSGGWGPWEAFPVVHGAYWNPTAFGDGGSGAAVAATLSVSPSLAERWFSLWLDMPEPGSRAQSGYELRFTNVDSVNRYDVTLSRWVSGTRTVLASSSGYTLAPQSSFALVDVGGTVSAWIDAGGGFGQLLTASDATFSRGYVGLEGAGNITRIRSFRGSGS